MDCGMMFVNSSTGSYFLSRIVVKQNNKKEAKTWTGS